MAAREWDRKWVCFFLNRKRGQLNCTEKKFWRLSGSYRWCQSVNPRMIKWRYLRRWIWFVGPWWQVQIWLKRMMIRVRVCGLVGENLGKSTRHKSAWSVHMLDCARHRVKKEKKTFIYLFIFIFLLSWILLLLCDKTSWEHTSRNSRLLSNAFLLTAF